MTFVTAETVASTDTSIVAWFSKQKYLSNHLIKGLDK